MSAPPEHRPPAALAVESRRAAAPATVPEPPSGPASHAGSAGERELQRLHGTADRAAAFYARQMSDRLNPRMQAFVRRMEMVFVSTADAAGACDCSIRCGPPGFVHVLTDRRLCYPEYRGNGVMASLGNLTENGQIGLLFVDFVKDTIGLHVNGRARVVETADLAVAVGKGTDADGGAALPPDVRSAVGETGGRRPERWVVVDVDEAYIHCSKHLPRFAKQPKKVPWGTDDPKAKGGDYFGVAVPSDEPTVAREE